MPVQTGFLVHTGQLVEVGYVGGEQVERGPDTPIPAVTYLVEGGRQPPFYTPESPVSHHATALPVYPQLPQDDRFSLSSGDSEQIPVPGYHCPGVGWHSVSR